MSEISKVAGLSKLYTNHSGRATTVHVLDEADAPRRHIMSATGHKSETSLKAYSGKTCEKTKKKNVWIDQWKNYRKISQGGPLVSLSKH